MTLVKPLKYVTRTYFPLVRVDCLNTYNHFSFYLASCSGKLHLGSLKQLPFPGYTQGYTNATGLPVSSSMFQEISELHTFKVLLFLHVSVRGCVPAKGMIPGTHLKENTRRFSQKWKEDGQG